MSLLNNYRIKSRIFASFSSLIIIAAAAAGFGYFQLMTIDRQIVRFVSASDSTSRNHEVQLLIAHMRRLALRVQTNADEATIGQFVADEKRATALLAAAAKVAVSDYLRPLYSDASETLAALRQDFDRLVKLVKTTEEARTRLFAGGDELTDRTEKLTAAVRAQDDATIRTQAADVEKSMLLVRVANWRFLATLDPRGPTTFKENAGTAQSTVNALHKTVGDTQLDPLLQSIAVSFNQYAANFAAVSSGLLESHQFYDHSMGLLFNKLAEDGAAAQKFINTDLADAQRHTDKTVSTTLTLQLVFTVITVLFGVGLAYPVGRSIVVPISGMTEAMYKLAAGDKSIDIPVRDAQDETGHMARAVEVFRQNMIEADAAMVERHRLDHETRLLSELNDWLQCCNMLGELYQMISEFLSRLLPACGGCLYIYAHSRDLLESAKSWNGGKIIRRSIPKIAGDYAVAGRTHMATGK